MHGLEACILRWERILASPPAHRQEFSNSGLAAAVSAAGGNVLVFHSHVHMQAAIGDQRWQDLRSMCVRMGHVLRVSRGHSLEVELWRATRHLGDAIACKHALNGFGMDATRSMTSRLASFEPIAE